MTFTVLFPGSSLLGNINSDHILPNRPLFRSIKVIVIIYEVAKEDTKYILYDMMP